MGIAVVGASAEEGKFSGRIVPSLVACRYQGGIYPVNPRYSHLHDLPCYPSLAAVPDPCDLAIVAVPADLVPAVVDQAVDRGLGAAVVLSAGFDEIGGEGPARADALRSLAQRIRIYGPNCPGLWQIGRGLVYTFSTQFTPTMLRPGPLGLITQGGALGRAVLDAMDTGLGFSYWFSTGNEADLEAADFLAFLAEDPATAAIALVTEGWRRPERFLAAAARCRRAGKPIVVLDIGRSGAGMAAARRHTGSPPRTAAETARLLRAAGCLRVDDVGELTDLAALLVRHPRGRRGGLALCTFSGGAGGLLADQAAAAGAPLTALAPTTLEALRALLPDIAGIGNPVDLTTAVFAHPALVVSALRLLAADPAVALLLFNFPHRHDGFDPLLAEELAAAAPTLGVPLLVAAASPLFDREAAARTLEGAGICWTPSLQRGAKAAARWLRHQARRAMQDPTQGGGAA
jgi:acyl-CoA synthetase (NDP forming)